MKGNKKISEEKVFTLTSVLSLSLSLSLSYTDTTTNNFGQNMLTAVAMAMNSIFQTKHKIGNTDKKERISGEMPSMAMSSSVMNGVFNS